MPLDCCVLSYTVRPFEYSKVWLPLCQILHLHHMYYFLPCSIPFNSPTNEAVVSTLSKEVMANNPQFQACDIKG